MEYYRYDALGRRIFQRMVLDTGVICQHDDVNSGCKDQLTRTVWDGDQILYEIRAPGDTTSPDQETDNFAGALYGNVGYTEGLGLDQPLDLFKATGVVIPFANWRGPYDIGTCPTTVCSGSTIVFPAAQSSSYGDYLIQPPTSWWGSIITGGQDGSGYQYKRNRYYDPTTGRFTQEDPIGLAGGLNLYGFVGGDPVNYVDPFGTDGVPAWFVRLMAGCSAVGICTQLVNPILNKPDPPVSVEKESFINQDRNEVLDGLTDAIKKLRESQAAVRDMTNGLSDPPANALEEGAKGAAKSLLKKSAEAGAAEAGTGETAAAFLGALDAFLARFGFAAILPKSLLCNTQCVLRKAAPPMT